jgi:hypothetical protein
MAMRESEDDEPALEGSCAISGTQRTILEPLEFAPRIAKTPPDITTEPTLPSDMGWFVGTAAAAVVLAAGPVVFCTVLNAPDP